MDRVRLGVIGCGVMGRVDLAILRDMENVDLVAVADLNTELAKRVAEDFGVKTYYVSGEELIEDNRIDAVILTMPAFVRTGLALYAFSHGKHVLTEKPAAVNSQEVERMLDARGSLVAGCCSSRIRFLESARVCERLIASGVLGDLRIVRCRGLIPVGVPPIEPPPAWRLIKSQNGGGILMNLGCYDLDFIFGLLGWSVQPQSVFAQTWGLAPEFSYCAAPGSDAETHYLAMVRCGNGSVVTLERGEAVCAEAYRPVCDFIGSRGTVHINISPSEGNRVALVQCIGGKGAVPEIVWEGDEVWGTVHAAVISDFVEAIRQNRQPKTGLEQALLVQQVTDAIYASAESGKLVEIGIDRG